VAVSASSIHDIQPHLPALDAELVAGVRTGDAGAARRFYDRHADRVYRTAFRLLRDRDAAEEVTQDVFVRALDSLDQLRDAASAGPWLSAIAVRLAYNALRARRRRERRFFSLDHFLGVAAPPPAEPLVADHLRQAIARLSSKLQLVLVMYDLEGYGHAEIAGALGIPLGTSKSRLAQARAALRQELAAYARPELSHD